MQLPEPSPSPPPAVDAELSDQQLHQAIQSLGGDVQALFSQAEKAMVQEQGATHPANQPAADQAWEELKDCHHSFDQAWEQHCDQNRDLEQARGLSDLMGDEWDDALLLQLDGLLGDQQSLRETWRQLGELAGPVLVAYEQLRAYLEAEQPIEDLERHWEDQDAETLPHPQDFRRGLDQSLRELLG